MCTIIHDVANGRYTWNHNFLSRMLVPGPVMGLRLTGISASVLEITWSKPEVTNGDILLYSVTVETRSGYMFQENVPSSQKTVLISSLCKILLKSTRSIVLCA